MSTKEENIRALKQTRQFLYDLLSVDRYPKNKTAMRAEARRLLKHYPLVEEELFNTPEMVVPNELRIPKQDKIYIFKPSSDYYTEYKCTTDVEGMQLKIEYKDNGFWYTGLYYTDDDLSVINKDINFPTPQEAARHSLEYLDK